jgi:ABC-2 type transport system permease protein
VAAADVEYRTSENPRFNPLERLRAVLRSREVVTNLTSKELKIKYKSTVLGVVWSMLNPLLYLVVFFIVFKFFLPSGIPDFAVYLLSGLLGYTLFSTALQTATISVVDNASLVSKVAFPREVLPVSAVGASLVNFFYQFLVLVLFITAVSLGTAALNVRFRDTRHLVELSLVAWFWITPIVYPSTPVLDRLGLWAQRLYFANPLTSITLAFQRGLYGVRVMGDCGGAGVKDAIPSRLALLEGCDAVLPDPGLAWYYGRLGIVAAASIVLLLLTWWFFFRRSADFAEEL